MLATAQHSPVPGFPIKLTEKQLAALNLLLGTLSTSPHSANQAIHDFAYLLISDLPLGFHDDDSVSVLNRFIILYHLQSDATFQPSYSTTPTLSHIQWFFRLVGAFEAYSRREESLEGMYG